MQITLRDIDYVTKTLYMECRGEPQAGQEAVAWVLRNRFEDPHFPNYYSAVCLQPSQFSCWNAPGAGDELPGWESPTMRFLTELFFSVLEQTPHDDPTQGANHYLNIPATKKLRGGDLPSWVDLTKITAIIGRHTFLKL